MPMNASTTTAGNAVASRAERQDVAGLSGHNCTRAGVYHHGMPSLSLSPWQLPALLAIAISPALTAQHLRTIDTVPYGSTPVALHGQDAGANWASSWFAVDANHPVGVGSYWQFENDVLDVGPMQSHGINNGANYSADVPAAIAAWSTSSLALVAANQDHVDLTPHVNKYADLNHGTIAVWVKSSTGSALTVLGASDSTDPSHEIALSLSNGRPWFDVRGDLNSYQQVFSSTTINDGTWHHMCSVSEGNGVTTLYIDGLAVDTRHQGFFRYVFGLDTMSIGRNVDSGGPQWYFDGLIDDLAIWASPLSAADVTQLVQGSVPPVGLIGSTVPVGPMVEAGNVVNSALISNGIIPDGNKIVSETSARAGRSFSDTWNLTQTASYYMSCTLRREDSSTTIEPALIEFTDSGATRGLFGWDGTGTWVVGGIGETTGAEIMQANTDYFCVLRIDSGAVDTAYLKVFAPGTTAPADDAGITTVGTGGNQWTAQSPGYASGADMFTMWLTTTGNNRIELDEIRMGSSWESVVRLAYGQGCLGAEISASGRPLIGSGTTLLLSGGTPNNIAAIFAGLSSTTSVFGPLPFDLSLIGAPAGCSMLQSNEASVLTIADTLGNSSFLFPLPANPLLLGVEAFAQWVCLDPSLTTPLPFRVSSAYQILVQN